MLGSYAAHDHRAMVDQAKKACIRIPALTVRDGNCRLDGHSHSADLIGRSAIAEGMQMPPFLF